MKVRGQQGFGATYLVSRIRFSPPMPVSTHKQTVRCTVVDVQSGIVLEGKLVLVVKKAGANAYLHLRKLLHQPFQLDTEACERALLHLARILPAVSQLSRVIQGVRAGGQVEPDAQVSLGIAHVWRYTLSERAQRSSRGLWSQDGKLFRQYRCTLPTAAGTSSPLA